MQSCLEALYFDPTTLIEIAVYISESVIVTSNICFANTRNSIALGPRHKK